MDTLYVESGISSHPRVESLRERFPRATEVECERYGEVFNVRSQNFRLQKKRPALILAEKHGETVLPTPPAYSIGRANNFYFSHMLNCLYDCRYCFLQGMYQSANYVYFVNFEDFEAGIDEIRETTEAPCFFSGYDCDSLVMESLTGFASHFVPFFSERPDSWLELRTKSLNTTVLEKSDPVPNIIAAYTLSPDPIAREIEHGAPPLAKRLKRVRSLAQQGWMVGLRLDPLIPWPGFADLYPEMVEEIFDAIDADQVHSVTLGPMRFPRAMHEKIVKLYPYDPLFALGETELREGQMTYPAPVEDDLVGLVTDALQKHLPDSRIFRQTG
jgi:spore photoproduct lyase